MFISQKGLDLIKEFEGCILQSYDDYNDSIVNSGDSYRGTLTIGYGHIENVYAGQTISQEEADNMLKNDMAQYCNQLDEVVSEGAFGFSINQNMYDALVSFGYNLGQGCLRTLGANGTRDKQTVANMILEYRNKGSVWEQGLLRRRTAERELFLSDADVSQVDPQPVSQEPYEYDESGTASVCVDKLNVRTAPSLGGEIVASYGYGEEFTYNHVIIAEGYTWVRYTGASSGEYRYVAVKNIGEDKRYANCY
ncbi:glycoside hydrolase family protein [Clostridium sp. HBUAS56017]|uniref:glycoside hydrolase family protein n=1 Tax=Clostridium sp. HBUAS56017 TaxID=2571128 RepID=UPI001178725F|nr:glycoside hydrolase family protein [Clostridium sp. HBUAS56017]